MGAPIRAFPLEYDSLLIAADLFRPGNLLPAA
jgi:hypothetical protein